ncbi:MAG: hypothetical protein V3T22_03105 [Planctomycetota bacterium]
MTQRPYKRRQKLPQPALQLRLTMTFVGLVALALMLQVMLFINAISDLAASLPNDSLTLIDAGPTILIKTLGFSFLIFLPLTFAVGVLSTFRIAGPLHRFEAFLNQVLRGEQPGDFRLRQGDELQHLASLINAATELSRQQPESDKDSAQGGEPVDAPPSLARPAAASEQSTRQDAPSRGDSA